MTKNPKEKRREGTKDHVAKRHDMGRGGEKSRRYLKQKERGHGHTMKQQKARRLRRGSAGGCDWRGYAPSPILWQGAATAAQELETCEACWKAVIGGLLANDTLKRSRDAMASVQCGKIGRQPLVSRNIVTARGSPSRTDDRSAPGWSSLVKCPA